MKPWNLAPSAFPDYPPADLPPMPEGFTDSSYKNDACPSIICEPLGLQIFLDYASPFLRESDPGMPRFSVVDANQDSLSLAETNDWAEVLLVIERHRREAWRAARVWCADAEAAGLPHIAQLNDEGDPAKGYAYPDGAFIWDHGNGEYWTLVSRDELTGTLAECEAFLWQWHSRHEYTPA